MDTNTNCFHKITEEKEFNKLCLNNFDKLFVVLFYADWHDPSKHMVSTLEASSKFFEGKCIFVVADADNLDTFAEKFDIEEVPTLLFMKSTKEVLNKIKQDSIPALNQKIEEYYASFKMTFEAQKVKMFAKIEELVSSYPLFTFIKGTPSETKCGFSETLVNALKDLQLKFASFDILSDEDMRSWVRYYAKWNSYPQVYVQGKFIGGLDTTKGLIDDGKFQELVKDLGLQDTPENVAKRITSLGPVVAIIDGKISEPTTIKSEEMVRVLNENGIRYSSFDITAAKKEIVEALQSNYKIDEFPQLIVNQTAIGNIKVVKQLVEDKQLQSKIPKDELIQNMNEKLKELINTKPVMLFMKGIPDSPQCGFSRKMIELLNTYSVEFGFFNILGDKVVRERLKEYSNWQTYPQLYVEGELVGGIEIAKELDAQGELGEMFEKYIKTN